MIATNQGLNPAFHEAVCALAVNTWDKKKKNRHIVRGSVILPKSVGKDKKILVIAEDEEAEKAQEAGADLVVGSDEIPNIVSGAFEFAKFDLILTTPEMLKALRPAARKLRGLTPTVKKGTVLTDIAAGVKKFRNSVEFKTTKTGVCNVGLGKLTLDNESLKANLLAYLSGIRTFKPEDTKGEMLQKVHLTTSRGPSVEIAIKELKALGIK
ncbi:50S ribosomal protein L1 [Sphaeroforma arctica JP610]|uniref:50S ribosomal protein L1 n=1 Tax=Sphaeroforma arctica JP610 TaxID=667725 RepID=A0A0L0G655_9EUKA|nr:50S ribosomal protein L1 [Sphaeroforma arctica JP610]KNC84429.1 50S ribosomal protein L1 [Sphaeroforma arctica JP610]|eukprot:XP_014158331.1 50S ribosomal protein L1 [Sphaeroforma arctica JP610]